MGRHEKVQVVAQGHLLRVCVPGLAPPAGSGGRRGEVTSFSRESRKRILELLARVDLAKCGFVAFVTLTYPDRDGPPGPEETERDRRTFFKRIRRAYPQASAIWRREHEARKSGAFPGVVFPHYHLIFFGLPFVPHGELRATWAAVLDHDGYIRTEIQGIQSWRQAFSYVAKYMAKVEAAPAAGSSPPGSDGAGAGSLVYVAYLTAEEGEEDPPVESGKPRIGRSWGVFRRKLLPLAEPRVVKLRAGKWLDLARDLARREFGGIPPYDHCGFTLFRDDPDRWVLLCQALHDLHEYGVVSEEAFLELHEAGLLTDEIVAELCDLGALPADLRPERRN